METKKKNQIQAETQKETNTRPKVVTKPKFKITKQHWQGAMAGALAVLIIVAALILTPGIRNLLSGSLISTEYTAYSSGLQFKQKDNGWVVTGLKAGDTDKVIEIPKSYNYKPVIGIEPGAFKNNTNISTVNIGLMPDRIIGDNYTMTYIGESAFEGCSNLIFISLPPSLQTIGAKAFKNCSKFSSIRTSYGLDNLTFVDPTAFEGVSPSMKIPQAKVKTTPEPATPEPETNFSTTKANNGKALNIKISGRVEESNASNLEKTISSAFDSNTTYIEINLNQCVYIDEAGLRVFLALYKRITAQGGNMKFINVNADVYENSFLITGFDSIFDIQKK